VRAATAQYVREHADAFPCKLSASAAAEPFFESTAPGDAAFAGAATTGSDGAGTAVVLRACCYCGVLAPRIKRCSGCWPRKQVTNCSYSYAPPTRPHSLHTPSPRPHLTLPSLYSLPLLSLSLWHVQTNICSSDCFLR